MEVHDDACDLRNVDHVRHRELDPAPPAVTMRDPRVQPWLSLLRESRIKHRDDNRMVVGVHPREGIRAHVVICWPAGDRRDAGRDERDRRRWRQHQHGIGRALHQSPEPLFRALQRLLCRRSIYVHRESIEAGRNVGRELDQQGDLLVVEVPR